MHKLIKDLDLYYELSKKVLNFNIKKWQNYELIINKNNFNEHIKAFNTTLSFIISEYEINKKAQYLMKIYELMDPKSEVILKYKPQKDNKDLRIFGDAFIKENKNKFKFINV